MLLGLGLFLKVFYRALQLYSLLLWIHALEAEVFRCGLLVRIGLPLFLLLLLITRSPMTVATLGLGPDGAIDLKKFSEAGDLHTIQIGESSTII